MATIFDYLEPDVLVCNEVVNNPGHAIKILDRCLNVNGETKYSMASFSGSSGASTANALYFNTEMFSFHQVDRITSEVGGGSIVRLIDVFTLYYSHPNLALGADTTFVTVFAAHLKAGNSASDRAQRARATEAVMQYVEDESLQGNYLMMGDLNVYSDTEDAFQNLIAPTNSSLAFIDPINRLGDWNNNGQFADVHTQSTHSTSNGCASGGGLDDRLDFVLVSDAAKNNDDHMEAIKSSYWAVANDGNHFNESINFPANTSVPANVLDAIYENSDHLPVRLDFIMTQSLPNSVSEVAGHHAGMRVISPTTNEISFQLTQQSGAYDVEVYAITGQLLARQKVTMAAGEWHTMPLNYSGMVIVSLHQHNQLVSRSKVILR